MNSLRQIPLHMLLLAGLVSPMQAKNKDDSVDTSKVKHQVKPKVKN